MKRTTKPRIETLKNRAHTPKITLTLGLLALAALVLFSVMGYAGRLEPSAPPGPTMKTLDEVEPRIPVQTLSGDADSLYVISQPGSYYLTGNITGEPNKCGVKITAANVTLDLMGFTVKGVPSSGSAIKTSSGPLPIEEVPFTTVIRNGTICNWGGDGIRIDDISVTGEEPVVTGKILVHSNSELLNLSIHGNTEMGFRGGNCCAHMEQVSFCNNAGNGIEVHEAYLHMEEVSVYNNTGHGLVADDNSCCRMEDVAFSYNGGHGMHILGMMTNVDAYGTCSTHNLGNGMYVDVTGDGYVHMEEVSFSHNHGNGVQILGMMTNVDAYSGWASNNNGGGIIVNGSANLTKCSSIANGQVGIQVGDGSTVKKCTARRNSGDGILVSTNCVVSGNACQGTGTGDLADTAGIRATGSGNRIEANHITDNDRGIDVDASGNLIIRNSASGNTADYDIAAGNTSGPTVDDTDITTSSNPHANYAI